MAKYDYDLIVIGGGGGGITASVFAAGLGKKVAMYDKKKFGGECTWSGCVPSKALLQSAKVSHIISSANKYGISFSGNPVKKYDKVMKSVRDIISKVYKNERPEHFERMGISAYEEVSVKFIDSHTIEVNGKRVTSDKFLISTGSAPMVPPIHGFNRIRYYTNENIFSINKLPDDMIVMGAGPIGLELGSAFQKLGVNVTIIEMAPAILFREDRELTEILHRKLISEGLKILTGAKIIKAEGKNKITITYEKEGKKQKITTSLILIAAGRIPNTEGLDLEKAGVKYDRKGIKTDKQLKTTAENIYAAGDVAGPYQFSHTANYQAVLAINNAFIPLKRKANYDNVPWCTFTDPELARSGLTEKEARGKYGNSIRVYKSYYSEIDRGITDRNETGMAKFICGKKGKILGIHILGERAGELMQEAHLAKSLNIPLYKLDSVIHGYPIYSDILKSIARSAYIDKVQSNLFVKLIKRFQK